MSRIVPLLIVLLAAGCSTDSRERLKTLGAPPSGPTVRNATRAGDSLAAHVDILPATRSRSVNGDQVFVATVYDRDGQPRGRQRVEWTLEGPGQIVAVDEGGILLNRGKRIDSRFGYGYTGGSKRTVRGDRDDPRDDFDLQPGQTWCLVTSSEPGVTTVTAHAPDIADDANAKAVARLTWTEGFIPAPGATETRDKPDAPLVSLDVQMPRAVGVNQDVPVTIALVNGGLRDSQPLTVRATVPDGVEILRIDPTAQSRQGNAMTWSLERLAAGENKSITVLVRPTAKGAMTVVAAAQTADGLRAEQKVGTNVDAAGFGLTIDAPASLATGEPLPVRVTVTNTGNVPVENAVAWVDGPDSTAKPIEKSIGTIPARESKTVTVPVTLAKAGRATVRVHVTANGGLTDRAEASVQVVRAGLDLTVSGSQSFPVGQDGLCEFRVTNRGDAPLANVVVRAAVPRPLAVGTPTENGKTSEGGTSWTVGTLAAGESKVVRLSVTGDQIVDGATITARAEGELGSGGRVAAKDAALRVAVAGLPVLRLQLAPPDGPIVVGGRAVYRVTVRNRGNAPARDVLVTATLTDELRPIRGSGPDKTSAEVASSSLSFGKLAELAPDRSVTYILELDAIKSGSARVHVEIASRELAKPILEEQAATIERRR